MHLTALWAFGVCQPVFSLVDGNPELLVLRDTTRIEVMFLAISLTVLPPLAAVSYVWLAGQISQWVGDILYLIVLGAFLVPIAFQVARLIDLGSRRSLLMVLAICVAGVTSYAHSRTVRLFVGYSIVLPIVGFVWFMQGLPAFSDEAIAASVNVRARHPVVVVVLDEFPVSSVMTRSGAIDSVRYPNFARLAHSATWYRNAATVHDSTASAVPAILTGRTARLGAHPFLVDHPENLFTLLGGEYALHVHEANTRLCPENCIRHQSSFAQRVDGLVSDVSAAYLSRVLPRSVGERHEAKHLEKLVTRLSSYTLAEFNLMLHELSPEPSKAKSAFHSPNASARTMEIPSIRKAVQIHRNRRTLST